MKINTTKLRRYKQTKKKFNKNFYLKKKYGAFDNLNTWFPFIGYMR